MNPFSEKALFGNHMVICYSTVELGNLLHFSLIQFDESWFSWSFKQF